MVKMTTTDHSRSHNDIEDLAVACDIAQLSGIAVTGSRWTATSTESGDL